MFFFRGINLVCNFLKIYNNLFILICLVIINLCFTVHLNDSQITYGKELKH